MRAFFAEAKLLDFAVLLRTVIALRGSEKQRDQSFSFISCGDILVHNLIVYRVCFFD